MSSRWWQASSGHNFEKQARVLDHNDEYCSVCEKGGRLLCCEGPCRRSFHAKCVRSTSLDAPSPSGWASGDFLCQLCVGSPLNIVHLALAEQPVRNNALQVSATELSSFEKRNPTRWQALAMIALTTAAELLANAQLGYADCAVGYFMKGLSDTASIASEPLRSHLMSCLEVAIASWNAQYTQKSDLDSEITLACPIPIFKKMTVAVQRLCAEVLPSCSQRLLTSAMASPAACDPVLALLRASYACERSGVLERNKLKLMQLLAQCPPSDSFEHAWLSEALDIGPQPANSCGDTGTMTCQVLSVWRALRESDVDLQTAALTLMCLSSFGEFPVPVSQFSREYSIVSCAFEKLLSWQTDNPGGDAMASGQSASHAGLAYALCAMGCVVLDDTADGLPTSIAAAGSAGPSKVATAGAVKALEAFITRGESAVAAFDTEKKDSVIFAAEVEGLISAALACAMQDSAARPHISSGTGPSPAILTYQTRVDEGTPTPALCAADACFLHLLEVRSSYLGQGGGGLALAIQGNAETSTQQAISCKMRTTERSSGFQFSAIPSPAPGLIPVPVKVHASSLVPAQAGLFTRTVPVAPLSYAAAVLHKRRTTELRKRITESNSQARDVVATAALLRQHCASDAAPPAPIVGLKRCHESEVSIAAQEFVVTECDAAMAVASSSEDDERTSNSLFILAASASTQVGAQKIRNDSAPSIEFPACQALARMLRSEAVFLSRLGDFRSQSLPGRNIPTGKAMNTTGRARVLQWEMHPLDGTPASLLHFEVPLHLFLLAALEHGGGSKGLPKRIDRQRFCTLCNVEHKWWALAALSAAELVALAPEAMTSSSELRLPLKLQFHAAVSDSIVDVQMLGGQRLVHVGTSGSQKTCMLKSIDEAAYTVWLSEGCNAFEATFLKRALARADPALLPAK